MFQPIQAEKRLLFTRYTVKLNILLFCHVYVSCYFCLPCYRHSKWIVNPTRAGGVESTPLPYGFLPFTKKIFKGPWLKFLDFFQLLVSNYADPLPTLKLLNYCYLNIYCLSSFIFLSFGKSIT